ncbi:MAG: phage tail terminator-like protein [Sphingomonas sp.]
MSAVLCRKALEVALSGMSPSLATAWENAPYSPVVGTAYQAVSMILARPADIELSGRIHREQGFLQINLMYPLDTGPNAAETRAELVRSTFYASRTFTASGVTVHIDGTPEIAPARVEDNRYMVPVRVRFYAHITRS